MKLAVLVEFFPPKLGSDRRIYEIMKRLSYRHEVHFVVVPPFRMLSGKLARTDGSFASHFAKRADGTVEDGIVGHFVTLPRSFPGLWRSSYIAAYLLTMMVLFPKVVKILRKVDPDVTVLNYPSAYTGALGYLCCTLLRKKTLLDFNDLIAQYTISLLNLKNSGLKAKLLISIQDHIMKKSDKIVTTLNYIKTYAMHRGVKGKDIIVVPNGVDTKFFNPGKFDVEQVKSELCLPGKQICLYCGRLDKWAGMEVILDLSRKCRDKIPNLQFVVVGADGSSERAENLTLVKRVPYKHVPRFLAAADIVLIPFPKNQVSHATSPLKLFEAMSMGKSIIASRVNGIEEIVKDGTNGILVEPEDVNQWYEAISFILGSKRLAAKISENARLTVEKRYQWTFIATQYERILRHLA